MSILNQHRGSYDARGMIEIFGSFQINGSSAPDVLRDGKTALFTVARTSAGLFTVTIAAGFPIPERLVMEGAWHSCDDEPVLETSCKIVTGSYSQSARTFQILCTAPTAADDTTPAPTDPDDNSRVNFLLKGSIDSSGTDAA